jgi:hypothetical protein
MNKYYRFAALAIISLLVLLGSVGCLTGTPTQQAAITENKGNISTAVPAAEAPKSSVSATNTTPDNTTTDSNPVSGQNGEIDLRWEQLCLSSEYQVQIAKDPDFTIIVLDTGAFAPASATSPGAYYPAGGQAPSPSSVTSWANLEAGHTYYWRARVRQAATGQRMLSPWSDVESFTVKSGFTAGTTSYDIQPIQPNNGCSSCPAKFPSFSWSPLYDTTKYRFELAGDPSMTEIIKDAVVTTTAYEYDGQLEYSQTYFWRVMALEPTPSDWSAIFSFRTEAAPPAVATSPAAEPTPVWVWPVIVIGLILLCVIIVLIFRLRRH